MNLETLDLLSTKVEKALETIRALKADKLRLEDQLASLSETNKRLRSELDEKDHELVSLQGELDKRAAELQLLHETVQDRDGKIQMAAERLEHVMNTLETELGTALNLDLAGVAAAKTAQATVSAMPPELAASLFALERETESEPVRKEEQASFFDYGGTNP